MNFIIKRYFALLALLLFVTSNLQAKELIFVLAGQSNMVGQGKALELSPAYRGVPRNVEFYYNGYKTPLNRSLHGTHMECE